MNDQEWARMGCPECLNGYCEQHETGTEEVSAKTLDEFATDAVRESVLRALSMLHQKRFSAASSYLSVAAMILGILPDHIREETEREA